MTEAAPSFLAPPVSSLDDSITEIVDKVAALSRHPDVSVPRFMSALAGFLSALVDETVNDSDEDSELTSTVYPAWEAEVPPRRYWYVVIVGREVGIFESGASAIQSVNGVPHFNMRQFTDRREAEIYYKHELGAGHVLQWYGPANVVTHN